MVTLHVCVAVVSEPARWTQTTLPAVRDVLVNATVQPNVYCAGRGNPAPQIAWTKDGRSLDGSGTSWYTVATSVRPVDTNSNIVVSTLSWQGTVTHNIHLTSRAGWRMNSGVARIWREGGMHRSRRRGVGAPPHWE